MLSASVSDASPSRRFKHHSALRWLRPLTSCLRGPWEVWQWRKGGKVGPLPHRMKQEVVRQYGQLFDIRILVETGTYMGDMVRAMVPWFDHIYSIELDPNLYEKAAAYFRENPKVTIVSGDSATRLPEVMAMVKDRCLFWLDGHYSGGITARGKLETPIINELKTICEDSVHDHVILIDDARCFVGEHDYPTIDELRSRVNDFRPEYVVDVVDDVIRVHRAECVTNPGN